MRAEVRYKNKAVYSSQTREWMYGLYSTTLKVNWIKADVRRNHTSLEHFYASVIIMVFVGAASFRDIVTNDASIQCHRGSEDILGVPYIICINIWIYIHPYMHPYIHPYMQLRFSRSMFSLPHLSALCPQIACHENEKIFYRGSSQLTPESSMKQGHGDVRDERKSCH